MRINERIVIKKTRVHMNLDTNHSSEVTALVVISFEYLFIRIYNENDIDAPHNKTDLLGPWVNHGTNDVLMHLNNISIVLGITNAY